MEILSSHSGSEPIPFVEPELLLASFSLDGTPATRNEEWTRILGDLDQPWIHLAEDEQDRAANNVQDAARGLLVTNEFFLLPNDGDDPLPLLLNFLPVHARSGEQAQVTAVVVTGEVLREPDTWMQNQTQRNRIETLGRMTMGIVHDFNNLLSGILGYTELLKASGAENEPISTQQEYLATIERAALDGAALIRKIQQYIRREQQTQFEPVDLGALIQDCVALTRPYWFNEPRRKGIAIEVNFDRTDIPPVLGSGTELREVFINLILNAVQAMPKGGRVDISTRKGPEERVQVIVLDTGVGMAQHVVDRIFEPLYTTKGARGSGMGLAVSYGIIQEHDGDIEVTSKIGGGTRFDLSFPTANASSVGTHEEIDEPAAAPSRILVVDDEPMVRSLLTKLLSRRGHEVVAVESGKAALGLLKREHENIDIMFTDHGMPDMNGRQLAEKVRRTYPVLPIILLTGDTEIGGVDETIDAVVAKPFKLDELDGAIRDLLERSS